MIVEIVHAAQITIRPVNRNRYRSPLATKSGEEPNYLRKHNRPDSGTGTTVFVQMLNQLEDPESEMTKRFNREHDKRVVRRLMDSIKTSFEAVSLEIFSRYVVDGCSAEQTAEELNVSVASVHQAKSRILRKLREQAGDLIDDLYLA